MALEQEIKDNSKQQEFAKLLDQECKNNKLVQNKIIKAKVVEILKGRFVVCDASYKSEAMIPVEEFTEEELSKLKINQEISCFVEQIENFRTGELILSYKKAKSYAAWEKCLKAHEKNELLTGVIKGRVKGGFILELFDGAISTFLPQSQLSLKPVRGAELDRLMNTPLKVKISRIDRTRGNISTSRKDVLLESYNEEVKEALKNIKEGDVIENVVVKSIPEGAWGAFIDLGNNLIALCHQSDISHSRISSVKDIFSVGQIIPKVMISKIDKETNRISVSIRALTESPYENIEKSFEVGKIYDGKISKCVDYGIFVTLTSPETEKSVEALCHRSQISWTNPNIKPDKFFKVSDKAKFKILNIDKAEKKISVSYKECQENPWDKMKDKIGTVLKLKVNNITDKFVFGELVDFKISSGVHWKDLSYSQDQNDLKKYKKNQIIDVKLVGLEENKVKLSVRELSKDPWDFFKENNKRVGDVITTRVIEALKSGAIKVALDADKKIITTIKKSELALESADQRSDIFSGGEKLDAKILDIDFEKRLIKISPKEHQRDEQASLIKKFGKNASTSGRKLADIFKTALGKKKK